MTQRQRLRWALGCTVLSGVLLIGVIVVAGRQAGTTAGERSGGASAVVDLTRQFDPITLIEPLPPVESVRSVPADEAGRMVSDEESVLGVVVDGQARAYPVEMMTPIDFEVINDTLGGRPIVVTWCTLCQTGLAFDRMVGDRTLTFHIPGMIWQDNMVMADLETNSSWSQLLGRAMAGPMEGTHLPPIPTVVTNWGSWRGAHPGTSVMLMERITGLMPSHRYRYPAEEPGKYILGIEIEGEPYAWTLGRLREETVVNDSAGGVPLLVSYDPERSTATVFDRTVGDRVLTFREDRGALVDDQTGTRWDRLTGRAEGGELEGRHLRLLPAAIVLRSKWLLFHPRSRVDTAPQAIGG